MQFLADVSFKCPDCQGRRFRDEVLEVRVRGASIADVLEMSADAMADHFHDDGPLVEALGPMRSVGLGYLRVGQSALGPVRRRGAAAEARAALVEARRGSLVILDEPTTGLHRRDVARVFDTLDRSSTRGVTVLVVEHDPYVAARADWVDRPRPRGRPRGGEIVAEGTPEEVAASSRSRFAPFLREALRPRRAAPGDVARAVSPAVGHHRTRRHHPRWRAGAQPHVPHLEIPRERLVAMTGPSGSGKSSLAFDVIYAEGQRRFLETLSPYARQYLPSLGRADVDRIVGIPPAISLEQRTARAGAMSTVATVTEVAHYLRLLYARAATPFCPKCDLPIGARSARVHRRGASRRDARRGQLSVWAPVVRARKGLHGEVIERARKAGIEAVRVDGVDYEPHKVPELKKTKEHDVWLWLGRAAPSARAMLWMGLRVAPCRSPRALRHRARRAHGACGRAAAGEHPTRVPEVRPRRARARPAALLLQHPAGALRPAARALGSTATATPARAATARGSRPFRARCGSGAALPRGHDAHPG
jgi:excinuclease ABC subunit A